MGNQRARREAFFRDNPFCCFCGGSTPAAEIDHIPARHLFRGRQWPEGYEFPACSDCNRASSLDELALGALVRIQVTPTDPPDEKEMQQAFDKLNKRRPEWLQAIRTFTRNEVRRTLKESGLSPKAFPGGEVYMVQMPEELIESAHRYGKKLGRALYYKATGRALPLTGDVDVTTLTNTQWTSKDFPLESFHVLNTAPALSRSGLDLSDQFAYRYATTADTPAAAFLVQFRESLVLLLIAVEDAQKLQRLRQHRITAAA